MLALITINYNQHRLTNEFLSSLATSKGINDVYVIVIDPSDKTPEAPIKKLVPNLVVIPAKNGGYSYGVNIGLREAQARKISDFCVINNDTYVANDFIQNITKSFGAHDAFGGKIYYAPGFEYHKDRYTKTERGHVLWYAGGVIDWKNVYTFHRGVDEVDRGQFDTSEITDFITGCLFCFNQKVLDKVGYWDEKYFLYYEDADYSMRVRNAGFELWYEPHVRLWHKNAQSTSGSGSSIQRKYQGKNRIRFGLKYAPWLTKLHLIKNMIIK